MNYTITHVIPTISKNRKRRRSLFSFLSFIFLATSAFSQVSLPERNPLILTARGGVLVNNTDLAAFLRNKFNEEVNLSVNTDYAATARLELGVDLLRFRGAALGIQFSGLFARPELKVKGPEGTFRVGLTQFEMARMNIAFSFNGSEPYTMFELPYHSNKEAVLGVAGAIMRTENTELTPYATDSLGITSIAGEYSQALGVCFGWNWRLGESGWVLGISGTVMWVINKSHLMTVNTSDSSAYYSGKLDFAPRILEAGIGYHF